MKVIRLFIAFGFACFFDYSAYGQKNETEFLHELVQQRTDEIFEDLVNIRRDFHMHPEISEYEKRTSKKIEEYLLGMGLEVKKNIGGYGVIGILNSGKEGKNIAWRADIDAMPSDIPDVVDYESVNLGVRHICGHDVHTSVALGIANVLTNQKESLTGNIYFIFQPSEENYEGAQAMIKDGLFEMINIDEIYGLHISPFPVGTIATKSESVFAHTNKLKVIYNNTKKTESKIEYIKELIFRFHNVQEENRFWNYENLGDPEIGIENPNTIFTNFLAVKKNFNIDKIDNQLHITATLNSSNQEQLDTFLKGIIREIGDSEFSKDLESVNYSYEKAVVINNEVLTSKSVNSISDIYGKESFIPLYGVVTGDRGDDFAYFQKAIPGVYFFLGGANYETGVISAPHSPNFAVDEESIRFGVKYFSSLIVERLNDN